MGVLETIQKKYGKGAIMTFKDTPLKGIEVIPTGSRALDEALGVGGIPKGRITEISGVEGTGKSTIAYHILANAQALGHRVALIDAENVYDPTYGESIGIINDDLLISQPDFGEQGLDILRDLVESKEVAVIVVDSVSALVPKTELDGEIIDANIGLQARMMSKALRVITKVVSANECVVIFINQVRDKIGGYGSSTTTTGGRALKFYASIRIEISRIGSVKAGEEIIGNVVKAKLIKNKVAPPFREAQFEIIFGIGINAMSEILESLLKKGIFTTSGAWFYYGEEKFHGKGKALDYIKDNPEEFSKYLED